MFNFFFFFLVLFRFFLFLFHYVFFLLISVSGSHWAERVGADFGQTQQTSGDNLSTVGVDLSDWTFEKKGGGRSSTVGVGGGAAKSYGPVTFRTWDFGGQREYYATHQYFLRYARESEKLIMPWRRGCVDVPKVVSC